MTAVLAATEPGEILTYGELAEEAGAPGAARAVGTVLRRSEVELPWWRVVAADGGLVPHLAAEHARRLEAEGHRCVHERVRRRRPDGPVGPHVLADPDVSDGPAASSGSNLGDDSDTPS